MLREDGGDPFTKIYNIVWLIFYRFLWNHRDPKIIWGEAMNHDFFYNNCFNIASYTHEFMMTFGLLLFFLIVFLNVLLAIVFMLKILRKKLFLGFPSKIEVKRSTFLKHFSVILVLDIFIFLTIFLKYDFFPFGSDIPQYIYFAEKFEREGLTLSVVSYITTQKILFLFVIEFFWILSLHNPYIFGFTISFVIFYAYQISLYFLVLRLSGNEKISFFSSAVAVLLNSMLNYIYMGILANLLGIAIANIIFMCLLEYIKGFSSTKRLIGIGLLFTFLAFIHFFSAMIVYVIVLAITIINVFFREFPWTRILVVVCIMAIPIFLGFFVSFMYSSHVYTNYMRANIGIENLIAILSGESVCFYIANILVSMMIINKILRRCNILALWFFYIIHTNIILILIFTISRLIHRLYMLIYFPIIAGWFLYFIHNLVSGESSQKPDQKHTRCGKRKLVVCLRKKPTIIVSIIFFSFVFSYSIVGRPSIFGVTEYPMNDILENFALIRDRYGVDSDAIYIYINVANRRIPRWGLAMLGDVIIIGSKNPDVSMSNEEWRARYFGAVPATNITEALKIGHNRTLIIPKSLFTYLWGWEKAIILHLAKFSREINSYVIINFSVDHCCS